MNQESLTNIRPGTIIGSRYKVTRCLGTGSMAVVYACADRERDGQIVALKVLFPEVAEDRVALRRFRNEIFAAYGVVHENVVRAFEYIREGDITGYTLEYVSGGDLADKLARSNASIPIGEVIELLMDMCAGLQAIHDAGIIHRDMKPENILLTELGRAKIADFGIARTDSGQKLTEHGGVIGTIDYVSPEYMLNSHVDWRSDIYALGILAYEIVTGEAPFRGESVYATMMKRLKTEPKAPSCLRSECPAELDRIIQKAMARALEERYQSAQAMHEDLEALQRHYVNDVLRCANSDAESPLVKQPPPVALAEAPQEERGKRTRDRSSRVRVRDILPGDRHESGLERRTSMAEGEEVSSLLPPSSEEERSSLVGNRLWRSSTNASGITLLKNHSDPLVRLQRERHRPSSSIMTTICMKLLLFILTVLLVLSLAAVFFCGVVNPVECRQFLLGELVPWRVSLGINRSVDGVSSRTLAYQDEAVASLFPKLSTTGECSSIRPTMISKRFFA